MSDSEKETIKRYIRAYFSCKKNGSSEREALAGVADIHLRSSKGPVSISNGLEYLNRMWPQENIDITHLIEHLISWDFSEKYTPLEESEDIYSMEERIRSGRKNKWEELNSLIRSCLSEVESAENNIWPSS